jgi:protein-S-isoprenylcysteine O-methyltransferase Ste14
MRWGGVIGCWLPAWLAQWSSLDIGLFLLFGVGTSYWLLIIRIVEEEDMLRSEFGEEYTAYARRTKKFLPWVN